MRKREISWKFKSVVTWVGLDQSKNEPLFPFFHHENGIAEYKNFHDPVPVDVARDVGAKWTYFKSPNPAEVEPYKIFRKWGGKFSFLTNRNVKAGQSEKKGIYFLPLSFRSMAW